MEHELHMRPHLLGLMALAQARKPTGLSFLELVLGSTSPNADAKLCAT